MESIRCVIAEIPQRLLADIVQNMVEESGVIEVVGRVGNVADIPSVIDKNPVDVLILGMKSTELPNSSVDILNRISTLPIVGLVDDGRKLAVFLDNVGTNDILQIIRALSGISQRKSNRDQMN